MKTAFHMKKVMADHLDYKLIGGLNSMRDVTTKNKRISELVEQETRRLELELSKNTDSLKKIESDILEIKRALEESESNAKIYKVNISALKEQIEVLK